MKKLLLTFLLLGLLGYSPVQGALKQITLTDNNEVFFDLTEHKSIKRLMSSGDLSFSIQGVPVRLIEREGKILFHIDVFTLDKEGELTIAYKGKSKSLPLVVNYNKNSKEFDILEDLLYLRLQDKPLSCESSAAADIASFLLQKDVVENDIIKLLSKSSANIVAKKVGKNYFWGDPSRGFVGYMDYFGDKLQKPTQDNMTGYGVYEKPIADVLTTYSLTTQILNSSAHSSEFTPEEHLTYILEALKDNSMVELWGDWCTRESYEDGTAERGHLSEKTALKGVGAKNECSDVNSSRALEWYFYDAQGKLKKHIGLAGEHTFVLLGWIGDIEAPTQVIVWDTDTGYHRYDTVEWMRKWSKMNYRSLIVSKKED